MVTVERACRSASELRPFVDQTGSPEFAGLVKIACQRIDDSEERELLLDVIVQTVRTDDGSRNVQADHKAAHA